jgi:transposase
MSQADRDRLVALKKAKERKITQRQAAEELAISERQVRRLLTRLRSKGDKGVVHELRGRSSNRKLDPELTNRAIAVLGQDVYRGFGPTLASEYLANKHGVKASKETVRKWMREAGLWSARKRRLVEVHMWRERRERFGELVQWDTSEHDWLEGRGDKIYLIKMIDDATSRLFACFVNSDSSSENMGVVAEYLRLYGRPLQYYTDKASIFVTTPKKNHAPREEPLPPTQIGRALNELAIGWIGAHSPQAKGRVERSFQTAQDRLVKGLRVAGVKTLEGANDYLKNEYLPEWREKFTVLPACADDAHRPLTGQHNLDASLSLVEERIVGADYTIRHETKVFQIAREQIRPRMRGSRVRVENRRDGKVAVRWEDQYLNVALCEPAQPSQPKVAARKPTAKAKPRAKSQWMNGFWDRPAPKLAEALRISNETS